MMGHPDLTAATLDVPRLTRDHQGTTIELRQADSGAYTLSFAASSEKPVERFFGTEVLSHQAKAIRMERIDTGAAPLLFNHDWNDPIGMLTGGHVKDGRLVVEARLFDTDRAREVRAMMDGGLRNVSIGYEIHGMEEEPKKARFTATDWEPLEVSIVTVPADPSVGIGRSTEQHTKPVRIIRATPPATPAETPKGATMAEVLNAPAGDAADTKSVTVDDNAAPERLRITTIQKLGRQHKIEDGQVEKWVSEGWSIDDASRAVLDIVAERAQKHARTVGNPADLGMSKSEQSQYSIMKMIRAVVSKDPKRAGIELEASQAIAQRLGRQPESDNGFFVPMDIQRRQFTTAEMQTMMAGGRVQRDMTVATAGSGGYLVGTEHMDFIDLLRNRSVVMRMGARRMSGLVGNVDIPKLTAGATAEWQDGEADAIGESTPQTSQITLSPKTVGAYVELSRRLMMQSTPDAEALIMSDMAQQVALATDLAALEGTGANGQPTGISQTNGIGSVASGAFSYAKALEFQSDVATSNALVAGCGYVTTPAVAALAMQRETIASGGTPIWTGNMLDGSIAGMRAMSTNQVTAATMVFGDFSQLIVAEWGVLEVEINPYADFTKGIYGIRAMYSLDVGVRYAGAFSRMVTIS